MKREHFILGLIFIVSLFARLYFAFQVPYFDYNEAYFNLRQVEAIGSSGLPIYNDILSYGGRTFIFLPFFHYSLAFFDIFFSTDFVAKVLPNLFLSLSIIVVYLISKKITESPNAALVGAFVSGFIPILFAKTLNNVSVYSLAIPLLFLALYFFIKIQDDNINIIFYVATVFLFGITHASVLLLILVLLIYLILLKVEKSKVKPHTLELMLFTMLFLVWLEFLVYKRAFLAHGFSLIWQNVPVEIIGNYYASTSIFQALALIGLFPFVCGVYVFYVYTTTKRDQKMYLLISFAIAIFLLLWLKLISPDNGLMILGVLLAIAFAKFYDMIIISLEDTKFSFLKGITFYSVIILLVFSSVLPSFVYAGRSLQNVPSDKLIDALGWIRHNTQEQDVVLSIYQEGQLVNYFAYRKNVVDENFLLIENVDQRFRDVNMMFNSFYKTNAIELLNKYNVNYILFTSNSKRELGIEEITYIDEDCFSRVYDNSEVIVYESLCKLEEFE
ncbi:glycosyltransferase family 39 protein [Candidatus Woesearchaeota archaeon]|nr:glycosyltransferase family 39 protein [Candidatus Woesearchaeota archaeon]